jgi:hypothetical protein
MTGREISVMSRRESRYTTRMALSRMMPERRR